MTHVASPASIGHGDLAGVGPGELVVDVLGPHADVLARERVAHGGEAHVRRADHAGDAGLPRAGRDGPRELAGVGGGGVHLPVGGNHDRASCRIMPEATSSPGRPAPAVAARPGRDGRGSRIRRRMAGRVRGRSPRRRGARGARPGPAPAARPTGAGRGARRSRTATPRASRAAPPPRRGRSAAARRGGRPPRARRSPRAGGPAAATDRWRLADSALSTRLSSPRRVRATLPRLELQERRAGPDAAEERGDRLGALPGHDAVAAPDAPRRRQPDVAEAAGEDRGLVDRDHELEVGAARRRGSASPGRGTGRAARPAGSARRRRAQSSVVVGQEERAGADRAARPSRGVAAEADDEPGDRRLPRVRPAARGRRSRPAGRTAATGRRRRAPRAAPRRGPGRSRTSGARSGRRGSTRGRRARPPPAWPPSRSQAR